MEKPSRQGSYEGFQTGTTGELRGLGIVPSERQRKRVSEVAARDNVSVRSLAQRKSPAAGTAGLTTGHFARGGRGAAPSAMSTRSNSQSSGHTQNCDARNNYVSCGIAEDKNGRTQLGGPPPSSPTNHSTDWRNGREEFPHAANLRRSSSVLASMNWAFWPSVK